MTCRRAPVQWGHRALHPDPEGTVSLAPSLRDPGRGAGDHRGLHPTLQRGVDHRTARLSDPGHRPTGAGGGGLTKATACPRNRVRYQRGAMVQAAQPHGPGAGRGAQEPGGQGRGLAGQDPPGVGADGEPGTGAGGPGRADRRPQPGRSARRGPPRGRPRAGGRAEPGAERPPRSGAVSGETWQGVGDGRPGGARESEDRHRQGRARRRPSAGGAVGAGDRRGHGAVEGDL